MYVNDTMITGWNYTGACNMTWNGSFRPYIYVIPLDVGDTPWASFKNSTVGYLGFDMDNKYGIVYEDGYIAGGDIDSNGWMHNCTVLENFIGINLILTLMVGCIIVLYWKTLSVLIFKVVKT
jgi:hypothetical protein